MELERRYQLETALFRLEQKETEVKESWKQAKFDSRTRWEEANLYDGSFRAFLDKLSGKQEEKAKTYRRALQHAEENLDALNREREMLESRRKETLSKLKRLPDLQTLCAAAKETPEGEKRWAKLETAFCAEQLLPLLDKTDQELEEYRQQLRGDRMGEIVSYEQIHETAAAHIVRAEKCQPLLQRIKEALAVLDMPLAVGGYFENPAAYIETMAAVHNRLNRVNEALHQVQTLRRQISELLKTDTV